jgi:hypothetical protein
MTNPETQPPDADADDAIEATVRAALEDLLGDNAPSVSGGVDAPDLRWLGLGLRLGLERPDRAHRLLEMLDAGVAPVAVDTDDIPARSRLLARSAASAASTASTADADPEIEFSWAARLAPNEIMAMGRTVEQMLADGARSDLSRGFGIVWKDGAKIPIKNLEVMFDEFTRLELVVVSVLAGRDLAAAARDEPKGRGGWLGGLGVLGMLSGSRRGTSPALHEADLVLRQRGKPASLGLVALWNVWTAVRYRELIPAPTFDLLVQPWVSVVGRLP